MPAPSNNEAQSFSVKRAEVEFHNFASLGEPDRAVEAYAQENIRRGAVIRKHLGFVHIGAEHAAAVDAFHRDHL